jgi:primase-polymerase (primpol)-like protein
MNALDIQVQRLKRIARALDLLDRQHYIVFRLSRKANGRLEKIPFIPGTDRHASISDPSTWRSFDAALADALRRGYYDGGSITDSPILGYRMGVALTIDLSITVVDEDDVIAPDGTIVPAALACMHALDSLTERSVSGTGAHVLVYGHPPANASKPAGVQVYSGNRFLLITGEPIPGFARRTIENRTGILARLFPAQPDPRPASPQHAPFETPRSDDEVIALARAARNGAKFARLFDLGDTGAYDHDHSRADQALVSLLSYWTQDAEQLDRLMRRSGLCRDKWTRRPDYRRRTTDRALKGALSYTHSVMSSRPGVRTRPGTLRVREATHA